MVLMALCAVAFTACDDDYYHGGSGWRPGGGSGNGNGQLNHYEAALVGSYVSPEWADDDLGGIFYLVLNDNRTGSFRWKLANATTGDSFTWSADNSSITVKYDSDGEKNTMEYRFEKDYLYVDGIPLANNSGSLPDITKNPLIGQWQGVIEGYYKAVFHLEGNNYNTVYEFTDAGEGVQLDFDIYKPKQNYNYMPFVWHIASVPNLSGYTSVLTITYQPGNGGNLTTATIANCALSADRFMGTMSFSYITPPSFGFAFDKTSGFNWADYISYTAARKAKAAASKEAGKSGKSRMRQMGEINRKPMATGVFATRSDV